MSKKKASELEVMRLEITAASKSAREVMARLDTLLAMSSREWPEGWSSGLYNQRIEIGRMRVWLEGWLDAIKQKQ